MKPASRPTQARVSAGVSYVDNSELTSAWTTRRPGELPGSGRAAPFRTAPALIGEGRQQRRHLDALGRHLFADLPADYHDGSGPPASSRNCTLQGDPERIEPYSSPCENPVAYSTSRTRPIR